MLFNLGKLAFFLILWFIVGIYLIPTALKKFGKYINDEILLIVSIGLCLAMVAFAEGVGFSAALGAFVMGSILAETFEAERNTYKGPLRCNILRFGRNDGFPKRGNGALGYRPHNHSAHLFC